MKADRVFYEFSQLEVGEYFVCNNLLFLKTKLDAAAHLRDGIFVDFEPKISCLKVKVKIEKGKNWIPYREINYGGFFADEKSNIYMRVWLNGQDRAMKVSTGEMVLIDQNGLVNKLIKNQAKIRVDLSDIAYFKNLKPNVYFFSDHSFYFKISPSQAIRLVDGNLIEFKNSQTMAIKVEELDFENNPYECHFGDLNFGEIFSHPGSSLLFAKVSQQKEVEIGINLFDGSSIMLKNDDVVTKTEVKIVEDC